MLETTSAEFQSVELWFTDQNNRPPEIEDGANITLIRGGFRVQKKAVTNFCKIDTIYIKVIALIFVVIVVVIIIIADVAILFCFEILVVTA